MKNDKLGGLMLQEAPGWITGASAAMQTLEGVIAEIAPTDIPVLLVGESGTGKEMFANRIHRLSRRCDEPLVRVSCASTNAEAFSAELGLNPGDRRESRNSAT